jgi:hypothetical protein
MMVLHEIYGDLSELAFMKYITQRANDMRSINNVCFLIIEELQ